MAMVEVDFSNMAGTNDFFRKMLAAERGIAPDELQGREDRHYTNLAMGVLCASMVATLEEHDGRTRMTILNQFASADQMSELLEMGQEQGMTMALDQIDGILAGTFTR